jgi:murein DD-endopeptidase MepM/ murein hydrolase activator NlpD
LDTIAQKNNVSVSDLIAANQISDPNFIKAQEKIKIPLIEREQSTSMNADRDRGFSSTEADPVVLGTDAIYPLAPTRRAKGNSESVAPTSTLSVDDRQNMGTVTNDDRTKTPYVNSLKADLDKLRQQYPVAHPETQSQSQPQLPIDSAVQPSQSVVVTVPDLPETDLRLNRVATEIAQASQDVASEEPDETPQAPENGYVQDLISDIERLRQNRAAQDSARVQLSANDSSSSGSAFGVDPEASSEESPELWQAAIEDQPEEKRQGRASRSRQNPKVPGAAESTSQDLLATGSQGTSAYQPLLQPTTGQMVTPQLPPLNGPETYLPDSPAIFNGYIWPANGVLSSGYGWRWGRMHNGIDIAGPVGTPIFAAAAGVVTYAGWNSGGYGNLVEIEHPDGSFTLYAHNNRILVREGQEVNQGEQVAEMGSTGFSTGPHLHFEIHPSGQGAVNPMAYLPSE